MEDIIEQYKRSRIVMLNNMILDGEQGIILSQVPITSWLYGQTMISDLVCVVEYGDLKKIVVLGTSVSISEYVISLCMDSNAHVKSVEVFPERNGIKYTHIQSGGFIIRQLVVATPTTTIKSNFIPVIKLDP